MEGDRHRVVQLHPRRVARPVQPVAAVVVEEVAVVALADRQEVVAAAARRPALQVDVEHGHVHLVAGGGRQLAGAVARRRVAVRVAGRRHVGAVRGLRWPGADRQQLAACRQRAGAHTHAHCGGLSTTEARRVLVAGTPATVETSVYVGGLLCMNE